MTQRADDVRHLEMTATEIEEPLPLIVVPDWDEQVRKASHLTRLIEGKRRINRHRQSGREHAKGDRTRGDAEHRDGVSSVEQGLSESASLRRRQALD